MIKSCIVNYKYRLCKGVSWYILSLWNASYYLEWLLRLLFQHTQLNERQLYQRALTHMLFVCLESSVVPLSQLAKEQLESVEKPSSELKLRLWIWSVPYSGWMDGDVL